MGGKMKSTNSIFSTSAIYFFKSSTEKRF